MISSEQFEKLKEELNKIKDLPIGWGGRRQNNADDDKVDLFSINNYEELIDSIKEFDEATKDYYRKRWFIIKISDCDEFLISQLPNTTKNPDQYSKRFDFILKGHKFDVKGTKIPFKFKDRINEVYINPQEMIHFYYEQQSRGRRFGVQNRLFIITVDEEDYSKEWELRTNFDFKKKAFIKYLETLTPTRKFFNVEMDGHSVVADIIFIIKNNEDLSIKIASDQINQE